MLHNVGKDGEEGGRKEGREGGKEREGGTYLAVGSLRGA